MEMEQDSSKKFFVFAAIGSLILGGFIFFLSKGGEPSDSTANVVSETVASPVETKTTEVKADRFANLDKASFFAYDSYQLTSTAETVLSGWVEKLSENTLLQISIEGHCDERGGDAYNLKLGKKRAQSVKDFLVSKGIDGSRLHTVSFGKRRPYAKGKSEASFAQNRRFEIKEVSAAFAQK
jgi:peptidoglycan-associated lipoprotein